jgi:hypothetical protein
MNRCLRAWKRAAVVVLSAGTLMQATSCVVDTEALVQSVVGSVVTDFVFGFFNVAAF